MTLYIVYFKHISQYVSEILNEFKSHKSNLLLNGVGRKVENGFGHLNLMLFTPWNRSNLIMANEKGKQLKLEKIKFFKEGCISQGKGFSALNLAFILWSVQDVVRIATGY